ncbi:SprT-like domain-containing protein [Haloarculaceae archaeon H-GB11]|nr:SprT-like domain-containing protein [Haloarculaceae archaeon H-GB11]
MTDARRYGAEPSQWPPYGAVDENEGLCRWSAAYCARVVRRHRMDVDLSLVGWRVSTRAKRRAAAVHHERVPDAEIGVPYPWDDGPRRCTLSLTWGAFDSFDRSEWSSTLRHELVHVEQFQRFGTTSHGPQFRERADDLDTERHCRTFAEPKYRLHCAECESLVARRYRDCDLVREYDSYRSSCCDGPLELDVTADD